MPGPRVTIAPAYAKINLTLEILGRRADGYHELASVMQTVALHDVIAFHAAPVGVRTLFCDVAELNGDQNLALRAAHALAQITGGPSAPGVRLELQKMVPTQAGLGGGSSDAACVLATLAARCDPSPPPSQVLGIAANLGSDVPFFLWGGTALVRGRGEQVVPLPDVDALWIVLVNPPVAVPTPDAYRALGDSDFSDGTATAALVSAIQRTRRALLADLVNGFEASVLRTYSEVAQARQALMDAGAPVVCLSGSGPTLFAPFESLADATRIFARMRDTGHTCWLTHTIARDETAHLPIDGESKAPGGGAPPDERRGS